VSSGGHSKGGKDADDGLDDVTLPCMPDKRRKRVFVKAVKGSKSGKALLLTSIACVSPTSADGDGEEPFDTNDDDDGGVGENEEIKKGPSNASAAARRKKGGRGAVVDVENIHGDKLRADVVTDSGC
jgi:hypothetical protein